MPLLDKVNIIRQQHYTTELCQSRNNILAQTLYFYSTASSSDCLLSDSKLRFSKLKIITHLWGPSLLRDSVLGGLCPSALLHSDFWVCTQPAWSSRRQHAVSRSWWENISLENISIHLLEIISTHLISIILNLSVYCLVPSHTRSIFGTEVDKIQLKILNFKQFKNNPLFLLVDKNIIRFYPGKDWKF